MIADQGEMDCVNHALSICRLALGYPIGTPDEVTNGRKTHPETILQAANWLNRHTVEFFCHEDNYKPIADKLPPNCTYLGDHAERIDTTDRISIFSYQQKGTRMGHFVIGFPTVYGDTEITLVILVNLKGRK